VDQLDTCSLGGYGIYPQAGIGTIRLYLQYGIGKSIPVLKITKKPSVKTLFTDGFLQFPH
jgi:hypothetical protein